MTAEVVSSIMSIYRWFQHGTETWSDSTARKRENEGCIGLKGDCYSQVTQSSLPPGGAFRCLLVLRTVRGAVRGVGG